MPVSNCKQTRAVTHSCELQERICFRTVTILNFFRKLFVQLIQYSYLCHSQTESIRHNGETGLHADALSQKTNKHGKPAMNALNHSNIHVITLLLVVLRR